MPDVFAWNLSAVLNARSDAIIAPELSRCFMLISSHFLLHRLYLSFAEYLGSTGILRLRRACLQQLIEY